MSEPFIGDVSIFAGNFAPRNWALCDGQLLAISSNQSLFAILGTTYGGDGRTTFGLPRLRGRVPIGAGNGTGLSSRPLGQLGGNPTVALNSTQIPAHTHTETGAGVSVVLRGRTAENGTQTVPAPGNVFGKITGGAGGLVYLYSNSALSLTPIAGLPTLATTVQNAGSSSGHVNHQPYLALNYIIALVGIFPSRN